MKENIDEELETLKEVQEWLDDKSFSNKSKIQGIVGMLFSRLEDDDMMELLYDKGDDFEFYLNVVKNIDFDAYEGECIREMHELVTDEFIKMQTFPSDKMIKQYKSLKNLMTM